jgi:hypothetical protein
MFCLNSSLILRRLPGRNWFGRQGIAMASIDADSRSPERRAQDESIAAESQLPPLDLSPEAVPSPLEARLGRIRRHPVALTGIVENGVVRFLDPDAKLPERSRVIVVAESA